MVYYDHYWEGGTTSKCQNWVAGLGMSDAQTGRISRFSLAVRLILGHPLDHCGFVVRPVFFSRPRTVGYTSWLY